MKPFKFIFPIIPVIFVLIQIYLHFQQLPTIATNNLSPANKRIDQLIHYLHTSQVKFSDFQVFHFRQEAEFLINLNNHPIKIIMSLRKNTFSQVTALQSILKKDNIEKKTINLIDFSSTPAYATFQNI